MSTGKLLVAPESTYATAPGSGWRQLKVLSDGHKAKQEELTYQGIDSALDGPALADTRLIDNGGEGVIEYGLGDTGIGVLLKQAFGSAASAVKSGGTLAYQQDYATTPGGPPLNVSLSTEVYRARKDGTVDAWTYSGGRCTQVEFGVGVGDVLVGKFSMDYTKAIRQPSTPSRSPAVVTPGILYGWPDALVTLTPVGGSGNAECISSFGLTILNELDVDDKCMKKGTSRHEPTRQATPAPTGTLNWKYQHPRYYDAFKAGTVFGLTALFEGYTAIESSTLPSILITVPAIKFDPNDPQISVSGPTEQDLPFKCFSNGTDPMISVTVITADTTF